MKVTKQMEESQLGEQEETGKSNTKKTRFRLFRKRQSKTTENEHVKPLVPDEGRTDTHLVDAKDTLEQKEGPESLEEMRDDQYLVLTSSSSTIKTQHRAERDLDDESNIGQLLATAASKTFDEIKGMELLVTQAVRKTSSYLPQRLHRDESNKSSGSENVVSVASTSNEPIVEMETPKEPQVIEKVSSSREETGVEYVLPEEPSLSRKSSKLERKPSILARVSSRLSFKPLRMNRSKTEDTLETLSTNGTNENVCDTLQASPAEEEDIVVTTGSNDEETQDIAQQNNLLLARVHALVDDDSEMDESTSTASSIVYLRDDDKSMSTSSFVSQVPYFEPLLVDPFHVEQAYDKCLGY